MSFAKIIAAVTITTIAGAAATTFVTALPEPAIVTLVFAALASIGLVLARKPADPVEG